MVDGLNAAATAGPQSSTVDALSLHWYPASSHDKHDAREDMNATRLDKFSEVFRRFRKDVAPGWTGEVWAGETASLQNGGGSGVSDRFQSTTWLYDQLGQQGDVGVSRLLRESVTVGNYATVNGTSGEPFPDYYSTVLWRRVVGSRVLAPMHGSARVDNRGKDLRVYSRCARTSTAEVVVVVVNLSPTATSMLTLEGAKAGSTKKEWLLTAGNSKAHGTDVWDWGRSDEIALNGAVLKLSATGDAPPMAPKETAATQPVAIAPLSVALAQYTPAAGAKACAGSRTVPSKTDDDAGTLPCDIYAAHLTPCVAAHAVTRALFRSYAGPLYRVQRASDGAQKDIGVVAAGGIADTAAVDSFCPASERCSIIRIYDQTHLCNHLAPGFVGHMNPRNPLAPVNATTQAVQVGGRKVYAANFEEGAKMGYRNDSTRGVARGDEPESIYMVVDGKRYNDKCCFEYVPPPLVCCDSWLTGAFVFAQLRERGERSEGRRNGQHGSRVLR